MRLLLLSGFITFTASCGAASAARISDEAWSHSLTATNQVQRSLRGYVEEVSEDEDRAPGGASIEKAAGQLDDALATVLHRPPHRLSTGFSSAVLAKIDDITPKVKAAMKNYPEGLSASALKQLRQVEEQRIKYAPLFAKMNNKSREGMQREIKPFPGMKTAPTMTSHVGRNEQVYTDKGGRMVVCGVVARPEIEGGGILLMSNSEVFQATIRSA
ncbi:hypothetical protein PF008_g29154 [Phytophthora fragariae]|uniref:RxLR effector protein n=1 Tax=Phytophthora fragariae TaxID=53985 RepID=A0A6G0Q981_9STRA|nr:hypothetical protein PF008_g29154 [Phytophthora fragariae]